MNISFQIADYVNNRNAKPLGSFIFSSIGISRLIQRSNNETKFYSFIINGTVQLEFIEPNLISRKIKKLLVSKIPYRLLFDVFNDLAFRKFSINHPDIKYDINNSNNLNIHFQVGCIKCTEDFGQISSLLEELFYEKIGHFIDEIYIFLVENIDLLLPSTIDQFVLSIVENFEDNTLDINIKSNIKLEIDENLLFMVNLKVIGNFIFNLVTKKIPFLTELIQPTHLENNSWFIGKSRILFWLCSYTNLTITKLYLYLIKNINHRISQNKLNNFSNINIDIQKQTIGKHITEAFKIISSFRYSITQE